jgi:hypothetical protein
MPLACQCPMSDTYSKEGLKTLHQKDLIERPLPVPPFSTSRSALPYRVTEMTFPWGG